MSIAVVITVFAGFNGFAPTYYLRPYFTNTPLMPLLHLRGLVFTRTKCQWSRNGSLKISLINTHFASNSSHALANRQRDVT